MMKGKLMGVNAIILLPCDTRVDDVAQVAGALAGLPVTKNFFDSGGYSCKVEGAKATCSSMPEMANVDLRGPMVDGETQHSATWHWESDRVGDGSRLLYPRSNPFWIAVGVGLVKFFGGSIVYSDCAGDKPDFKAKKPRKANNPDDGEPWRKFQDEKLAVKPLTKADIEQARAVSAYK